jgi:hypothetical protein
MGDAGEEWPIRSIVNLWQPPTQLRCGRTPQRNASIFATFSMKVHAGTAFQDEIGNAETGEFGDPGTGVVQRREHRLISLPGPAITGRRIEDRLNFVLGQETEQWSVKALHRDGEDALNARQRGGIVQPSEVRKGSNGRQARIAGANGVVAFAL